MKPPVSATSIDGRAAAVLAVADALTGRGFARETLERLRTGKQLDGRAAALAREISHGALRHLVTIEHVLTRLARLDLDRTKPTLRAVLLTAAYQVIWMDRVPVFAAVDQAVELARRHARGRTPGMVNAVLRRLAGAVVERRTAWHRLDPTQVRVAWDAACRFDRPVLPTPACPAEHLAAATGERRARFEELAARYGVEAAELVAWTSQAVPVTVLQRNPLRISAADFEDQLRQAFGAEVDFTADAAFLPASVSVPDSPLFQQGMVYVQDATAHAAATAVGARPGERILDLCAAPGGKSVALAIALNDTGELVACDADADRLGRVRENVARLGLRCVRTVPLTGGTPMLPGVGETLTTPGFDAALVDVPCSNTGVIARRPEARLGLTPAKLRSLVAVQHDLMREAARRVRPGGRLVYSTCSLEPQENEDVVAFFLAEHPEWRLDVERTTLPAWGPRAGDWRDGGYFARLVQRAATP